ncbi:hypothetical protein NL676_001965 [Syzygium grande]|nr:hypothetical protein NL676_001965 [Syzygium grande]
MIFRLTDPLLRGQCSYAPFGFSSHPTFLVESSFSSDHLCDVHERGRDRLAMFYLVTTVFMVHTCNSDGCEQEAETRERQKDGLELEADSFGLR